jgi:hypothetical protein
MVPTHYPAKPIPELEKVWKWCIDSGGEFFEKDSFIKL